MNDVEVIKAKMMFLGLVYFKSYGGFNRDEIVKKFEREFKKLELRPFDEHTAGYAEMDDPTIALFAQLGHELNSVEFDSEIEYYRGTVLHELIHKFLTVRDEDGQVIGTGLLKIVDRDPNFYEYLRTSKVDGIMERANGITMNIFHTGISENEFGRGFNEGYTEWFRKNILKNDENMSYEKLTYILDIIQKRLEKKNGNAIEAMRKFKDGDYDYIFATLNMSKEVGILFTRALDYMYAREYDKEMIKKYLEAKKLQKELKRDERNEEILTRIDKFCADVEDRIMQLRRFKKCKSELDFNDKLTGYIRECDEKETRELETIKSILERAYSKQDAKLEIIDVKDLQKDITSNIIGNAIITRVKTFIGKNSNKIKDAFQMKTDRELINQGTEGTVPRKAENKQKIKRASLENSKAKRFRVGKNGIGITKLINRKMKEIADNMKFVVQDTFSNIGFTVEDSLFETENVVDDVKFEIELPKREIKTAAIIAVLAALGISTGSLFKHCIDTSMQEIPAIEEVMEEGTKENEEIEIEVDENVTLEEEKEPEEKVEDIQEQEESVIRNYLVNGISLRKGDRVYKTSYHTERDIAKMAYDYDNLQCDYVRVIKDNKVLQDGELENIDELYKIGIENDAYVMIRVGVLNDDGTITYIAWCNLDEMIKRREISIEEQENSNKEPYQEEYDELEI